MKERESARRGRRWRRSRRGRWRRAGSQRVREAREVPLFRARHTGRAILGRLSDARGGAEERAMCGNAVCACTHVFNVHSHGSSCNRAATSRTCTRIHDSLRPAARLAPTRGRRRHGRHLGLCGALLRAKLFKWRCMACHLWRGWSLLFGALGLRSCPADCCFTRGRGRLALHPPVFGRRECLVGVFRLCRSTN